MSTNYEHFIAANQRLIDCMAGVPAEQYSAMSRAEQENVCKAESAQVRSHIQAGHADFKNILAERINSLSQARE